MSDEFEARVKRWLRERGDVDPASVDALAGQIAHLPSRPAAAGLRWLAVLIAAGVVITVLASVQLLAWWPPSGVGIPIDTESSPTGSIVPEPSATEPVPSWVADIAGRLECDGAISSIGGEVGEFDAGFGDPGGAGQPADSDDPNAALEVFLSRALVASLPGTGFEAARIEGHWARHDYLVAGRRKAVAVTSNDLRSTPDRSGWQVVGIRACDPTEFDPADGLTFDQTRWLDANDQPAPPVTVHSSGGPGHCGWESMTFLRLDGVQYIRDPLGLLDGDWRAPFDPDAELPDDAVDSGYHTVSWHLFTVPNGEAVYVQTANGKFERWGRPHDEVGCR